MIAPSSLAAFSSAAGLGNLRGSIRPADAVRPFARADQPATSVQSSGSRSNPAAMDASPNATPARALPRGSLLDLTV